MASERFSSDKSFDEATQTLTIHCIGSVDSQTAPTFSDAVDAYIEEHPVPNLVIDLDRLEYISSAGLRVMMRLISQFENKIDVINVSAIIYELLVDTNFTEYMNVKAK